MSLFLTNDTRRQLYKDTISNTKEDSAQALALKAWEVLFPKEKYYHNSEVYLKGLGNNYF